MSLQIHQRYSQITILTSFGGAELCEILCDGEFAVFSRAIACFFTLHSGSPSHFTTSSRFVWRPQRIDYAPTETTPWFPAATRETWSADRRQQLKEHHLFVKMTWDDTYFYAGPVHLASYGRTRDEFFANFVLTTPLRRDAWLQCGGSLAPRQPFASLPVAEQDTHQATFHRKTLELLHIMPPQSPEAMRTLDQFEKQHNLRLPTSVRQWYTLTGVMDIMHEISLMHSPADIVEYDESLMQRYAVTSPFLQMIPVMFENQDVWHLAVVLNGSDDPPVMFGWQGEDNFDWHLHAHHFSDFIYAWAWDYVTYERDYIINASTYMADTDIPFIHNSFQLQGTTYMCNGYLLCDRFERYAKHDQKITLASYEQNIDTWISAETVTSLQALLDGPWSPANKLHEIRQTDLEMQKMYLW